MQLNDPDDIKPLFNETSEVKHKPWVKTNDHRQVNLEESDKRKRVPKTLGASNDLQMSYQESHQSQAPVYMQQAYRQAPQPQQLYRMAPQ